MAIRPEIQKIIDEANAKRASQSEAIIETPTQIKTGIRPEIQSLIDQPIEQRLDVQEEFTRPTIGEFATKAMTGAKRELGELKTFATQVVPEAGRTILKDFVTFKFGTPQEKKNLSEKRIKQVVQASKDSPEVAKEILTDMGRTYGFEFGRGFDLDVAIQKWQEAPIESTMDAIALGGISKSGGKALFKSTSNAISKNKKKLAQDIISKGDVETKEILKNASDIEVNTILDDLYDQSTVIKKLKIDSQLDNPNYSEEIGKRAVDKINKLKKIDQLKLQSAIKKIEDQPIDSQLLSNDIAETLNKKGFLKDGNVLDVDNIEPGLSKAQLTKEIIRLNDPQPLTAGDLSLRMKNLDNKINWKNPKVADEGLMEIRRSYRNQLRLLSNEYDETALRVAEKLDKFESQIKKFEKLGAGEKFGKSLFSTKTELDEFINLMDKTPDKIAVSINDDLKTLKAWHAWNRYFKQNPDFIIGELPGVSRQLLPSIKKRAIKADIRLGAPRLRPKKLLRGTALPARTGLEIQDQLEEEQ